MEAGATGVSSDAPDDAPRPERTEDMARTAEVTMHHLAEKYPVELAPRGDFEPMADSVTNIATSYMPDIHNALVQPGGFTDVRLDPEGANANFNAVDSKRVLESLGQYDSSVDKLMGANDATQSGMVAQSMEKYGTDENWIGRSLDSGSAVAEQLGTASGDEIEQVYQEPNSDGRWAVDRWSGGGKIAASLLPAPFSSIGTEAVLATREHFYPEDSPEPTYHAMQSEQAISDHYAQQTTDSFERALNRSDLSQEEADQLRRAADEQIRDAYPQNDSRPPGKEDGDGGDAN